MISFFVFQLAPTPIAGFTVLPKAALPGSHGSFPSLFPEPF